MVAKNDINFSILNDTSKEDYFVDDFKNILDIDGRSDHKEHDKDDINQDEAQFKELNDEANTLNIDESISDESIEHKDDSILTLKNDTYTDITDDNNPEKSSQN